MFKVAHPKDITMTPRSLDRLVSLACVALTAAVLTGCGAVLDTDADEAGGPVASRSARPTWSRCAVR